MASLNYVVWVSHERDNVSHIAAYFANLDDASIAVEALNAQESGWNYEVRPV